MSTADSVAKLPLAGLRVLDLNAGTAPLCGQLLALLGADVVVADCEVEWGLRDPVARLAYDIGKQPLRPEGPDPGATDQLLTLAGACDVLVDGTDAAVSQRFSAARAGMIHLRITPFGLSGPRSGWSGSELIAEAAGGVLALSRQPGRPPAMLGIPVAGCAAGLHGSAAVLLGLRRHRETGERVFIDLSLHEAAANLIFSAHIVAFAERAARSGAKPGLRFVRRRDIWECGDGGYVAWQIWTGPGWGRKNLPMIEWMNDEGEGFELRDVPWEKLSLMDVAPAQLEAWESAFARFIKRFPKRRVAEEALQRRMLLAPVNDVAEAAVDAQLQERDAFVPTVLPDGRAVRVVGRPFRSTAYDARLPERTTGDGARVSGVLARWRDRGKSTALLEQERANQQGGALTAALPLSGVRVLDFSWLVAGPLSTKFLALFGADVVKVESRRRPDASRMTGPYPLGRATMDGSAHFANVAASKRSLGLDMTHPGARELLLRLGGVADVVVENFTPGTLARHGLGYEDFRAVNPGIVMLSLSLQGQTGYRATQPGLGNHLQALSGLDDTTGFSDAPPAGAGQMLPDLTGPWFGVTAVLSALEHRRRTGAGQYIDVSQLETMMLFTQPLLVGYQLEGVAPRRAGNRSPFCCPHGVYPSRGDDAWLAIAVTSDAAWGRLWALLPQESRSGFARDSTLGQRLAVAEALDRAIADWTAPQDGVELAERLQAHGVAAYPVNTGAMLLDDPQLAARGHYCHVRHELIGDVPVDAPSFRIDSVKPRVTPGPRYATASLEVLQEWLAVASDDVADMTASGLIAFE